jgi:hypothetical protein
MEYGIYLALFVSRSDQTVSVTSEVTLGQYQPIPVTVNCRGCMMTKPDVSVSGDRLGEFPLYCSYFILFSA